MRFGKADRLLKSAEFLLLQRSGTRTQSEHFALYGLGTTEERSRLGITVSRRIGNAIVRNRLKRRVRECFRLKLRAMLPAGTMIVVIARRGAGHLASAVIDAELSATVARLNRKLKTNPNVETTGRD